MKTNVIVDGMNIVYRSHNVFDRRQGLQNKEGKPTGTVYGFMLQMVGIRQRWPTARIVVAWEGKGSLRERQRLYSGYKANREGRERGEGVDPMEAQCEVIRQMLSLMGVGQYSSEGHEADDVIATLVRTEFAGKEHRNVVWSSDRDLLQLVGEHTVLVVPGKGTVYDEERVRGEYGVNPKEYLMFRVFDGDKSDNIPGLRRFPRKKIAEIVTAGTADLESIYTEERVAMTAYQRRTLEEFEAQAKVNESLMTLRACPVLDRAETSTDDARLKALCEEMGFGKITEELLGFRPKGFVKTGVPDDDIFYTDSRPPGFGGPLLN